MTCRKATLLSAIFTALTSVLAKILRQRSRLATGASGLCYHKALQTGGASKVVPIDRSNVVITLVSAFIFLHERSATRSIAGRILIGIGTLHMAL
ncbi:MAG: EamA family transporter [Lachnospiraceae bacterium]|nr:EamA family transporter [Lachnospiraceae bacterium]MCI9472202.1 EamA family transporter [Lachnospiraceae bacterium]